MGWRSFLKQQLGDGKALLIGGGSTELELTKHFKILKKLGKGSYATVYEAERLTDGQRYALKITDLHSMSRLDKIAVVEEIRLLASLDHPNLISYFEAFCDHDRLCVVTELVMGGDLGSFLSKLREEEDFLWERQVWSYFLQAALGVQYLHHNHVLHRDLKPQNIMLTKKNGSGLLKIVDLGVSAQLERVFTRVQIGTPHYMAPEMWERRAYSYSADVWALGCILHELCTLRPTFLSQADRTEGDIRRRVLAGGYAPIPSRYSMDISRLVGLMLQKDPKDRPTIDEILAMPTVRSNFIHLPAELQAAAAAAGAGGSRAQMESPLQLPDDAHAFNCMLPRARYATGPGVAELLCSRSQRRSLSLPDLQAAAAGPPGSPQRPASPAPRGAHPAGGGSGSRGLRVSASTDDLAGYESEEGRLRRRRSIMVGDLLFQLQHGPGGGPTAGAAGSSGADGPWRGHSLRDSAPAAEQWSAAPPGRPSPQLVGMEEGGGGAVVRGGEAGGHAGTLASVTAADVEHVEHGGSRLRSVQRRSVAVAEVLHYQEAKLKKQLEGKADKESIAELASQLPPLAHGPFEFCAPGTAASRLAGGGGGAAAAAPSGPSAPHHAALQGQVAPAGGAAGAAGAAAGTGGLPRAGAAGPGVPAVAQNEGKRKKKGRLWRLMYGDDEGGGSMHQPTDW